jgi:hypothetical protein
MPRMAAPAPRPNDNAKLMIIGGVTAAVILIMVIAMASSGNSQQQRQPARQTQPMATKGRSTHERMMNQRYGGEMEGKTVKEWMEENGETEFAKQRKAARQKR